MEILLSKLIPLFVYPVGLIAFGLLATVVLSFAGRTRAARVVAVACLLLLLVAGNGWTAHRLIRSLENDYPALAVEDVPRADVILVLGGGLDLPHPPRHYPRLGGGSDRLLHALRLHRAGAAPDILLTGGNVFPQPGLESESYYARRLLAMWGVPEERIFIEETSRNTIQNAERSARIVAERGWRRVLLVTSATHMRRAVLAFRHAGVEVTPVPTDFIAVDANAPEALSWIPSVEALMGTTHALREYLGRLWYRVRL